MEASSPVPKDHPLMIAWNEYKDSTIYITAQTYIGHNDYVDGALWAAFCEGWFAAGGVRP